MGKSTVAAMFEAEDVAVFDADAAVHQMQGPDGLLVDEIESAFPKTTGPAGVNRTALGNIVLADPERLKLLESIIHPAVAKKRSDFLREHGGDEMIVFDIPLLLENGNQSQVDVIVVVSAPEDIQRARVLARPTMTKKKFEQIVSLQMPDTKKQSLADYVINTGQTLAQTRHDVRKLVKTLRGPLAQRNK